MINLDQLRNLLGDEKLLQKYIDLFSASGPENLQKLKTAFKDKDRESLVIATHSLKTQFAYIGNDEAHQMTLTLENITEEQVLSGDTEIAKVINSLSQLLDQIITELNNHKSI